MARDLFHDAVRHALEKDGWTITADPFRLTVGTDTEFLIDLAAERLILAERNHERIAVEIKVFSEPSKVRLSIKTFDVQLLVFDPVAEEVIHDQD